jgi:hypothetical protein
MSGKQRFQRACKKQEDFRRTNKQRCTRLEKLRKKSELVARGIIHLDEQVWPGACNLGSSLDIPHAVLIASRHVLMRNLSLP